MRPVASLLGALAILLSACGAAEPVWAPDAQVEKARYAHDAPPSITLVTMIHTREGRGGHAALLINADERLLFDPAGTWQNPMVPERNDVLHGITPALWEQYLDYHARQGVEVILQEQPVPLAVAMQAKAAVRAYGAVPKAQCSIATTRILRGLPGYGQMHETVWPHKAMQDFALLPGMTAHVIRDDNDPDNKPLLARQIAAAQAAAAD